jgi:CCR4-NOT transcription complex subunit 1
VFQPSIATATNIDTLLAGQQKEEIMVPPEILQDKVFFIFNNLSLANMKQKVVFSICALMLLLQPAL